MLFNVPLLFDFSEVPSSWNPSLLSPVYYWNAADLADGDVTSWVDRVSAKTLTGAGSAQIKAATSCGNNPGVTFDGTDDVLAVTGTGSVPSGTSACEIWVVINQLRSSASTGTILIAGTTGANGARALYEVTSSSVLRGQAGDGAVNAVNSSTVYSGVHIQGGIWSSGGLTLSVKMDGQNAVSVASTTNMGTTRIRMGAGVGSSPNVYGNFCIGEAVITGELTALQRQQLEGHWAHKYGITANLPSDHPYKDRAP